MKPKGKERKGKKGPHLPRPVLARVRAELHCRHQMIGRNACGKLTNHLGGLGWNDW